MNATSMRGHENDDDRRRAVVVVAEAPEFQHAGHNVWVNDIINFLIRDGIDVEVVVISDKIGFLYCKKDDFRYGISSMCLRSFNGYYFVWGFRAFIANALWITFLKAPHWAQRMVASLRSVVRRYRGFDYRIGDFNSEYGNAFARGVIERINPLGVFFNMLFTDVPLSPERKFKKFVLVQDIVSDRILSLQQGGYRTIPESFTAEEEVKRLREFDAIVSIQWEEGDRLRRMVPDAKVLVVPVAMSPVERRTEGASGACMFVGSGSLPNVDGLNWFLEEVWPQVIASNPGAVLNVYGSVCSRVRSPGESVVLHGVIDSLEEAYSGSQVAVIPLRAGSGLKIKIVESLTHCMPTVTTSVGAQGLGLLDPRPFIVADEADAMAAAISNLLENGDQRASLTAAARKASKLFDPETVFLPLADALCGTVPVSEVDAHQPVIPARAVGS